MRFSLVAAARPNFMKIGPVARALRHAADVEIVHTGQHYDRRMSSAFFAELDLPSPDVNLAVGSGTHGVQTAAVLQAYEDHLLGRRPDAVVVVGDVNSTLAAALAAVKLHIPVAHVEAGLRSRDTRMPEEANRVLTDRVSRWLFTTSADADANLAAEGAPAAHVHLVGNVMIDTLLANEDRARARAATLRGRLPTADRYGLLTLHRPANVDDPSTLQRLLDAVAAIDPGLPVVFPAHPRTRRRLDGAGVRVAANIHPVEPLGYLAFVGLMAEAALVLTDSGGVQEETSVLGVPCLTLRSTTERPITCELGTNRLVGADPVAIVGAGRAVLGAPRPVRAAIPGWDGRAGRRIADRLLADMAAGAAEGPLF